MKILIAGDSFAASKSEYSWCNLLAKKHSVINLAQAGVGEYKIWQQVKSVEIKEYDQYIVCHTSPWRIHTPQHPVHTQGFHKDCDLMIGDIHYHAKQIKNFFNVRLHSANRFIQHHYDYTYQKDIYKLLQEDIKQLLPKTAIHLSGFEEKNILYTNREQYPGDINHMDVHGNQKVFEELLCMI